MIVMRCIFHGFVTAMGEKVEGNITQRIPYGLRARITRLDNHPRLGRADDHDFTITSEIRSIDFGHGLIVTQNSIYRYK